VSEILAAPSPSEEPPRDGQRPVSGEDRVSLRGTTQLVLMLGALGVVFGDIGTSPLYALQTVFSIDHGAVHSGRGDVFGVISLVFWSITLIVSVKYVSFIMRADNDGEGGIMALTALVQRAWGNAVARTATFMTLGVLGASLFYGDSVITPAISVLSAVEGLKVAAPSLSHLVLPISVDATRRLVLDPTLGYPPGRRSIRPRDGAVVRRDRGDRSPPGDPRSLDR